MNHFWNWQTVRNEAGEEQRELRIEGVIAEESWWGDEVTPGVFRDELMAGRGPVTLHISSPGGDCVAASRIYTMLMDYPDDVYVQIDGLAASAASVIAMAGTRVDMSPTALMMIHDPWTVAMGDEKEMDRAKEMLSAVKDSIINAYEIKTGLSRAKIAHLMSEETWLDAREAHRLGFCDTILYAEGEDPDEDGEKKDPDEPDGEGEDPNEDPNEEPNEEPGEDPNEDPDEGEEDRENHASALAGNPWVMAAHATTRLMAACLTRKMHARASAPAPAPVQEKTRNVEGQSPSIPASGRDNRPPEAVVARNTANQPARLEAQDEAAQRERVARQYNEMEGTKMDKTKLVRGAFLRSAITREPMPAELQNALTFTKGANPGGPLLPVEVSTTLIEDIYGEDAFLEHVTHTQIKGLRLPKVTAAPVADAVRMPNADAGETELTDAIITFGRFPGREKILVPGTIMRGTDTDLDSYITRRLNRDHRARMKERIFAETPAGDFAHMGVYATGEGNPGIVVKTGETILEAIQAAIADLPEGVRENAAVVMPYADWMTLIQTLANGAATLFGRPTKEMLGFEVVTCDYVKASKGYLVGDLSTIHINYDDPLRMETDRDINLDMDLTVIGYDYDIQVEDANCLRLAKVGA